MLSYKYNIEGAIICIKNKKKEIEKAKRYLQDFKKRSDNDGE